MITTYMRGHLIYYDGKQWRYADTNEPATDDRACSKCDEGPTPEGYDACLGQIPGATAACCGHGVMEPYVQMRGVGRD